MKRAMKETQDRYTNTPRDDTVRVMERLKVPGKRDYRLDVMVVEEEESW